MIKNQFEEINIENRLKNEATLISKYLICKKPTNDLVNRYVEANFMLFGTEKLKYKNSELSFIYRHPMSLPYIDAAICLFAPKSILRKKIIVMAAILETTPSFANFFIKTPKSALISILSVGWQGACILFKILIGISFFLFALMGQKR